MANKAVLEAIVPRLAQLGLKKRSGMIFTIEVAKDFLGWVGLNTATEHQARGEMDINPVIGVRHQEVERLVAELSGDKFHPYAPPTISSPLGYLQPEKRFKVWHFAPGSEAAAAAEMSAAIATHALPFIRSVTTLDELGRQIDRRMGIEGQLRYTRPIVALLAGDSDRAGRLLDEALAVLEGHTHGSADDFRRFAAALRPLLSAR